MASLVRASSDGGAGPRLPSFFSSQEFRVLPSEPVHHCEPELVRLLEQVFRLRATRVRRRVGRLVALAAALVEVGSLAGQALVRDGPQREEGVLVRSAMDEDAVTA